MRDVGSPLVASDGVSLIVSARVKPSSAPRAPRRSLGGRSSSRPLLVVVNECRFRRRSLSFARARVGRASVASRMRDAGSPLVACRRRVAHGAHSCRLVARSTCAATLARRALVVSTITRGGQRVSFSTEATVVRARACRSSRRRLSHERRRLSARCMSTTCRHGVRSCRLVVRDTCATTVTRRALVVSTTTLPGVTRQGANDLLHVM